MGTMVEDNTSIVAVFSVLLSQLDNGLFNKFVSSIWPDENPQFFDWMCIPMSRNNNSWACKKFVDIIDFVYDDEWNTTYGKFADFV